VRGPSPKPSFSNTETGSSNTAEREQKHLPESSNTEERVVTRQRERVVTRERESIHTQRESE